MLRTYRFMLCLLLLSVLLGVITIFIGVDRQQTLAAFKKDDVGEVLVIANSENLFEGWNLCLCWRKDNGPWRQYYLDHESPRWRDVTIRAASNDVSVFRGVEEQGSLDTRTGLFRLKRTGQVYGHPAFIVDSDDPHDGTARVYPGSKRWPDYQQESRQ